MSNVTSECVRNVEKRTRSAEKKGRPGFTIQPVPANENAPGTSVRALGARWGLDPSKVNLLGRTTRKVVRPQLIPGGLEPAQDEREAQPEDSGLDHPDRSGGDRRGDNPGQLGEPSGDRSRSLDQPKRTGGDRQSRGGPEDRGLSYETDDPYQAAESKRDLPAVPEANQNSTESRSSERDSTESRSSVKDSTDEPSTERTSTGPQASERSSTLVSNGPSTEEPEVDSESSEGTWRHVWTQGSRNRLDDSEVERNLLEENSDSKSGGRPSRYFRDWFNSEDNKGKNNLNPNEPDEPEENQERRKPIETGSLGGRSRKHEKRRSKQPVRPTGFRNIMTSISMAGPSETVSRNEQPKAPTAVRFGKGNNIPHGMKFAVEGRA